ncbi:asparagine synthetase B family protein [Steroidobacter agaridevorans]|uniref:asparagine synthetase B family protein n=1 Tax=Steroidobacter agaridevorans TaxID=2695856 RepID=UPI00137B3B78|nr:asparagine synthase-related protein [Steroidobacter agaridevorans]
MYSTRTAAFEISGESGKVLSPEVDVYLKGNCYLPQPEQQQVLGRIVAGGASHDAIRDLPGQFILVIHDKRNRKVAIVRDHLGQQPLYHTLEDDRLLFASSVRELRTLARRPWSFDRRGVYDYFAVKYTVPPATLFEGVSEQVPGTIVEFSDGKLQSAHSFFNRTPCTPLTDQGANQKWVAQFSAEFGKSLQTVCADADSHRFAVLSSGGMDSSMLVGAYRKLTQRRFPTIYVGCDGYKNDKAKEAEFVSRLFDTDHRNVYVSAAQFAEQLERTVEITDFPLDSPSTVLRSHLYARLGGEVDVLLSGEGADSLYTGYYIFDLVYRFYSKATARELLAVLVRLLPLSMLPGDRGRKARLVRQAMISPPDEYLLQNDILISNNAERLSGMLEAFDPGDYLPEFKRDLSGHSKADILNRILGIYRFAYLSAQVGSLAKLDDAYGLEHRHPFIHCPMIDAFNEISWDRKVGGFTRKRLVAEMAREYLPPAFFRMPKEGFGVPIAEWFRDPASLGQFVDLLNSAACRERGIFRKAYIDQLLSDYQNDRLEEPMYEQVLWPMVNFELWAKRALAIGVGVIGTVQNVLATSWNFLTLSTSVSAGML